MGVGAIATGCRPSPLWNFRSGDRVDHAQLTLAVQPQTTPGQYALSGEAEVPNGTNLTVLAIRHLQLQQPPLHTVEPVPTYSILAYDTVEVRDDRWQTTLALWKVAPNGEYREAWQLQTPDLQLAVEPQDQVQFLATLAPVDDLEVIAQNLGANNQRFAQQFIQTTSEGNRYLQIDTVKAIALPTGKTDSVDSHEADLNGGWGNRYLELPDLPNDIQLEFPKQRQTNAPIGEGEFLY
jgi:hypothetical protein